MKKYLVALVACLHILPHPFGVSPIGAMALYSGAFARPQIMWLVPLIPLLLADLIGGFYDPLVMAFVYLGFALSTIAGRLLLSRRRNIRRHGLAIVVGAVIFYLVSNFSIWLAGMYPQTAAGLVRCYLNGLPYLGAAIAANTVYSVVLFGLHEAIERRQIVPALP